MTLYNPARIAAAFDRLSNAHAVGEVADEKAMDAARAINDNLLEAPPSTVCITATLQVATSLGELIDIESHSWTPSWSSIEHALYTAATVDAPSIFDSTATPDAEATVEALDDVLDDDDVIALLIESATSPVPPVVRAHRGHVHLSARPIAARGETMPDDHVHAAAELPDGAGAEPVAVADDVARDYGTPYSRAVDLARTIAAMTAEHQVTSRGPDGAWEPVSEWDDDVDAVRREYDAQVEELGVGNVDVLTRYVTGGTTAATMPWRD